MEDNEKLIEKLLEKATDYGKTSIELAKLKAFDKLSDIISTIIPHAASLIFISLFLLFINLGIALWIGEILSKAYLGFLIVAGFYCLLGLFLHFFMHKSLKTRIYNYIINQLLN